MGGSVSSYYCTLSTDSCVNMGNCIVMPKLMKKVESVPNSHDSSNNLIGPHDISVLPSPASTSGATAPSQCSHPLPEPTSQPQTPVENNKKRTLPLPTESQILASPGLKSFLYNELSDATGDFSINNLLGEGGFGCVYKGWLKREKLTPAKPDKGMAVAIKKLRPHGFQGHKEWLAEVNYLGRLHHPNLVKLIGFCLKGENRLLVYEFMNQGSLEDNLFKRKGNSPLSWETRVKIAIGAAQGLNFLHSSDPQVIYRDFKASNILLDSDFNAKLSDFGLAKRGPMGDETHVSTVVMGTEGYAAPEYIRTGRLTTKCDVYSFGVVLFELITGRIAIDFRRAKAEQILLNWVKPHLRDRRAFMRIMDSKLEGQYPRRGAYVAATLAMHCVNQESKFRPPMSEVLEYLEQLQSPKFLNIPIPPPPPPPPKRLQQQPHGKPSSPAAAGGRSSSTPHMTAPNRSPISRTPRETPSPRPASHKSAHHSRFSGFMKSN